MSGEETGKQSGGMEITAKDGHLYIDIDVQREGEPSSSGKSDIIASTHGWQNLGELSAGQNFALSLNLIRRKSKWGR